MRSKNIFQSPVTSHQSLTKAMKVLTTLIALILPAGTAVAAERNVTLFLDGAKVEQRFVVNGGYLEIPLPAALKPGSLRLVPRAATRIERVETVPARLPLRVERELARLTERRERLQARLQALKTREGIFTAAAKAQSGKAPRKTKSNPEPLQNIRKGTDFALTQLEEVYGAKRAVEKELAALDGKEAALRKEGNAGGCIARVWLSGRRPDIAAAWLQTDLSWSPRYDIRLGGDGTAEVTIHPRLPALAKGGAVSVSMASVLKGPGAVAAMPVTGEQSAIVTLRLPVQVKGDGRDVSASLAFTMTNTATQMLPGGDISCYRNGTYIGTARLAAIQSLESREILCGE
ncbi:DUF4140 domain-containing protein [Geobacter argillaceus]|uniref:DUF4140 domain-containing protein n=1 Tax=Geobacter argillaceus TaxID=345631 RepID=A0A562VN01_9BACT|nr:DUF4140 domain-containing protein [Geobacter argillaceus]TWJ19268.1 hypothetical protein JN12_01959 [Geobacter argillaceus]